MSHIPPEALPIYEMGAWTINDAEAAVEKYVEAGPAAISWLEAQADRSFDGREGLDAAWAWTIEAIRSGRDIDAQLVFALAHLKARETLRREPRMSWGRYDQPGGAKTLGHNAPAVGVKGAGAQSIPAQEVANFIGQVTTSRTTELEAGFRDALNPDALSVDIDRFIDSLSARGLLETPPRHPRDESDPRISSNAPDGVLQGMNEEIVQLPDDEVDGAEGWIRETDDPDVRNVEATRTELEWQVTVWVAEFLREEPLEGELRRGINIALSTVPGVLEVVQEDREVWAVTGQPSGRELVAAAARVVDALAARARAYLDSEMQSG